MNHRLKTPGDVRDIVGQIVAFKVKDIDEHRQTFTASRKEALEQMAVVTWKTISPGQVRVAAARAVTKYRVIVDIGGITVPIPAREVSYYWVDDVRDYFSIGDTFDVKVLEVDQENKKVSVSTYGPFCPIPGWTTLTSCYPRDNGFLALLPPLPRGRDVYQCRARFRLFLRPEEEQTTSGTPRATASSSR